MPARAPGGRNDNGRLPSSVSSCRRSPGSLVAVFAILALAGWFTPGPMSAETGWTSLGLGDSSIDALGIDHSNPATLYAGTDGEGVFKSADGGATWAAINSGLPDLSVVALAIGPTTPSTLYASVFGSGVFKSTDGGASWAGVNAGLTSLQIAALTINPAAPATLYAGSSGGGVFTSADGGASWAPINTGLTDLNVYALAINPTTTSILYAGTLHGVFKSTNGGVSWAAVGLAHAGEIDALTIDAAQPAIVYAATSGGVFRSSDGGASWLSINSGLTGVEVSALAMDPANAGTLYSSSSEHAPPSSSSGVFKTTNSGGSWAAINSGLTNLDVNTMAIDSASPAALYAGTDQGVFVLRAPLSTPCGPGPGNLCLDASRFSLAATWTTPAGATGGGQAVALTDDTGYFWFFDPTSVEVVAKVVDGCSVNGHFWVFAAGLTNVRVLLTVTDTATGSVATYTNPQSTPFSSIQDTSAFVCGSPSPSYGSRAPASGISSILRAKTRAKTVAKTVPKGASAAPTVCDPSDPTTLCLNADRFSVQAMWQTPDGGSGAGQAVSITSDTGYFWFFDSASVEVVVKVLDGCGLNQRFWVFAAGLTNVAVTLTVTDVITGQARTYRNAQGTAFAPLQDTAGLATCLPSCDAKGLTVQQVNQATDLSGQGLSDPFGADLNLLINRFMALEGCSLQSSASSQSSHASRAAPRQSIDGTCAETQCAGVQYCGPGNSSDGTHWYLGLLPSSTTLNNACFAHDTCYTANCVPNACYFDSSTQATPCDAQLFAVCASLIPSALGGLRCELTADCFICEVAALASLRPTSVTPSECQVPPCFESEAGQVCNPATGMCQGASIDPTGKSFPSSGGSSFVSVTAVPGQPWLAMSNAPWISITSGAGGTGNGMVLYSVAANAGSSQRTGTMTIAGATFTVTQDAATGPPAQDSVTPASEYLGIVGGCPGGTLTGTFQVNAASNESWAVTWYGVDDAGNTVDVSPASGIGPGTLTVTITAAPQTPTPGFDCTSTFQFRWYDPFDVTFGDGQFSPGFTAYYDSIGVN
jgi:hypothetical protein